MKILNSITILIATLSTCFANGERPIRGYYEVPVDQNSSLAKANRYPVKFKSSHYEENFSTQIDFPLPVHLTGVPQNIQINRNTDGSWTGEKAEGNCQKVDREFVCLLSFKGLQFNQDQLRAEIAKNYPNKTQRELREQVAAVFGTEPVGIITYRLKGRER